MRSVRVRFIALAVLIYAGTHPSFAASDIQKNVSKNLPVACVSVKLDHDAMQKDGLTKLLAASTLKNLVDRKFPRYLANGRPIVVIGNKSGDCFRQAEYSVDVSYQTQAFGRIYKVMVSVDGPHTKHKNIYDLSMDKENTNNLYDVQQTIIANDVKSVSKYVSEKILEEFERAS